VNFEVSRTYEKKVVSLKVWDTSCTVTVPVPSTGIVGNKKDKKNQFFTQDTGTVSQNLPVPVCYEQGSETSTGKRYGINNYVICVFIKIQNINVYRN
jgi:hypothetical protein